MKTKISILVAVTAIITLSFTFASKKTATRNITTVSAESQPGGLAIEDAL